MPDDASLERTIRETAQSAKRAKGDNGELEQHSLSELTEADRYLRNQDAAKRGPGALRFSKLIPPGSA